MNEHKRQSLPPIFIGCLMSVFLIVSFFLPRIWQDNQRVESLNTLLIIGILCTAIHLVRKTSYVFYSHVWKSVGFSVLLFIPVLNLLVAACQFVWGDLAFMQHPLFTGVLVLFSLPAFCCYFFSVIWLFCVKDKKLMITSSVLDALGLMYIMIRLAERTFLPLFQNAGHEVATVIEKLFSISPYFSLVIYILTFVNFIICAQLFNDHLKNTEDTNKN